MACCIALLLGLKKKTINLKLNMNILVCTQDDPLESRKTVNLLIFNVKNKFLVLEGGQKTGKKERKVVKFNNSYKEE